MARKLGVGGFGGSSNISSSQSWWQNLWHLSIPNKVKLCLGCASNDALPCMYNLAKRLSNVPLVYPIYANANRTIFHALWGCFAIKKVWKEFDFYDSLKGSLHDSFLSLCSSASYCLSPMQHE